MTRKQIKMVNRAVGKLKKRMNLNDYRTIRNLVAGGTLPTINATVGGNTLFGIQSDRERLALEEAGRLLEIRRRTYELDNQLLRTQAQLIQNIGLPPGEDDE